MKIDFYTGDPFDSVGCLLLLLVPARGISPATDATSRRRKHIS
uniref:Uncharacterized protein n=1 Tax=Arundo donax TaxID=35708 RepID=A0A0A8XQ61_ARUDO